MRVLINTTDTIPARRASGGYNTNNIGSSRCSEGKPGSNNKQIIRLGNETFLEGSTAGAPEDEIKLVVLSFSHCCVNAPCKGKLPCSLGERGNS
mmetsp:Transcript_18543/g.38593  ORF Transcript_18543/g.38593 Transcript_18543/m.38593 type:complete len:94 (-) Transcript_18543:1470-1751(-)